jgi:hypothetical protein
MAIVSTGVLSEQGGPTIDLALAGAYHHVSDIHNRFLYDMGMGLNKRTEARAVDEQYNSSSKTRQLYSYEVKD